MNKNLDITRSRLSPTFEVEVRDHRDNSRTVRIAGESPLTIIVDNKELVTLMTLGNYPEELALGYLRNQHLIESIDAISSIKTDWDRESVNITLAPGHAISDWEEKTKGRIVTSGCGQGTVFSCTLDKLYDERLGDVQLRQSKMYDLLRKIAQRNEIYREAGAVHGCALCQGDKILIFVEDVGRHNAADAIAGMMWLNDLEGTDKIFYTTGRLTSEMVMKCAQMKIPVLLSRSGVTQMGVELAQSLNVMMIARARSKSFLVFNKHQNIIYDMLDEN